MPSAFAASCLGAFQAAFSVLLTLGYGVFAARRGMVDSGTAKNVSWLCVNMFLPALLITNVGSQIQPSNFASYLPAFVWSIVYSLVSLGLGKLAQKLFRLPSWVGAACAFNNTTSLPLLLTQSLTATGILRSITGDDVTAAVQRAQSFFLINSMVSNAATFAIGPKILGDDMKGNSDGGGHDQQSGSEDEGEADENSALFPKPITSRLAAAEETAANRFGRLPVPVRKSLSYVASLLNPTLWGAIFAVVIGLTPPLQRALFAETGDGGFLSAWLTSSLRNIGELFTALQMFVVGSKLSDSLTPPKHLPSPCPPMKAVAAIFLIRFVFWGLVSIPLVYVVAAKTQLLDPDPMLWWALMLMPIGPPAMILSSLAEVTGVGQRGKMMVARTLAYFYAVTPIMSLAVVAALRACEMILDERKQKPGFA